MAYRMKERLLQKVQDAIGTLQKNFECPICLELMKNPVSTKCDHKFCRMCIHEAIGRKASAPCPMCKEPFTKRSLQSLPKWNKIVTSVRDLSEAYQRDTGVLYSPSKHVLPSSARKQSSTVDLFSENKEACPEDQGTTGTDESSNQSTRQRGSNSKISLAFPRSRRQASQQGKSNSEVQISSDECSGVGNVRKTRLRNSLQNDTKTADSAAIKTGRRRTRSAADPSCNSRNGQKRLEKNQESESKLKGTRSTLELSSDEVTVKETLEDDDKQKPQVGNLSGTTKQQQHRKVRSALESLYSTCDNLQEHFDGDDDAVVPPSKIPKRKSVIKMKKSRSFESPPTQPESPSQNCPNDAQPSLEPTKSSYVGTSNAEDEITVHGSDSTDNTYVFPKKISYGKRRTTSAAISYVSTRPTRGGNVNKKAGVKSKSRHSDPGGTSVVVIEAVVHNENHSEQANIDKQISFVPVSNRETNIVLVPAKRKSRPSKTSAEDFKATSDHLKKSIMPYAARQDFTFDGDVYEIPQEEDTVISIDETQLNFNDAKKPVINHGDIYQMSQEHDVVISIDETQLNPDHTKREPKSKKASAKMDLVQQIDFNGSGGDIPVASVQIGQDKDAALFCHTSKPVAIRVNRRTQSKTRSVQKEVKVISLEMPRTDHKPLADKIQQNSVNSNPTTNDSKVQTEQPGICNKQLNKIQNSLHVTENAIQSQDEIYSVFNMHEEDASQTSFGDLSTTAEESLSVSEQSQVVLTQNRFFKYRGRIVTPKKKPKRSMIGTPTSDDPYSFKPSQKTPAKKKRGRKPKSTKQLVSFADETETEPTIVSSQCYELFTTPVVSKPKSGGAKKAKPQRKQKKSVKINTNTNESVAVDQPKSTEVIESQLQELIEKISQAEDFELVMSQQLREMEQQGIEDSASNYKGDEELTVIEGGSKVNESIGVDVNYYENHIVHEGTNQIKYCVNMEQRKVTHKDGVLCQNDRPEVIIAGDFDNTKTTEKTFKKPRKLIQAPVAAQSLTVSQANNWESAASMRKELAPRTKTLDIDTKQTSDRKRKRKRKKKKIDKSRCDTTSSDEDERPQIVDMSPVLLSASQQQWLVPRCVDSENDSDQYNSKSQKNSQEHESDTDSLGVHPLPQEYESIEDNGSQLEAETTCQKDLNNKPQGSDVAQEVSSSATDIDCPTTVPETPMVPIKMTDPIKDLIAKVSKEVVKQTGHAKSISAHVEDDNSLREESTVPPVIDLSRDESDDESEKKMEAESGPQMRSSAGNCANTGNGDGISTSDVMPQSVPADEDPVVKTKDRGDATSQSSGADTASSGGVISPTLAVETISDSCVDDGGKTTIQSDAVASPASVKSTRKTAKVKSGQRPKQPGPNTTSVSLQRLVKSVTDDANGSSQSDGVISPTCNVNHTRSSRKSNVKKSNTSVPRSTNNPVSVAMVDEESNESSAACDVTRGDQSSDIANHDRLESLQNENSSQSDVMISPTNHNETEHKTIYRHFVAETVQAIPQTLETQDELVEPSNEEATCQPEDEEVGTADLIPPSLDPEDETVVPSSVTSSGTTDHPKVTVSKTNDKLNAKKSEASEALAVVPKAAEVNTLQKPSEDMIISPERSSAQTNSRLSSKSNRKTKRRTFSLQTDSAKHPSMIPSNAAEHINQKSISVVEVTQDKTDNASLPKRSKQSMSSKELISSSETGDSRNYISDDELATKGSSVSSHTTLCNKQSGSATTLNSTDDVVIIEDGAEKDQSADNTSVAREDCDDVQVISVTNACDTAGESTEDPNAEKKSGDCSPQMTTSSEKQELSRQGGTPSRQVSSSDGLSSISQDSVSLLMDNPEPSSTKSAVENNQEDKQEKRLSGSKRSRTPSSLSSDSESETESQAKRRKSGIRIVRGLAARLKKSGGSVSTATNSGTMPDPKLATPSHLLQQDTGTSATTYKSSNQDRNHEMEMPDALFAGETFDPHNLHTESDAEMEVVETDAESDADQDQADVENKDYNAEDKVNKCDEVMADKEVGKDTDFVPPTPPKAAEDTSVKTPANRLLNRQLSITMEHILTSEKKSRKSNSLPSKRKSPPTTRNVQKTQDVEASESLLSGAKNKPKNNTEIQASCFAFEPETEPEPSVPFIETVDNDIFTADYEEETMDPNSCHSDHERVQANCVKETVTVSSDEDQPVKRGQRKSRAITDDSDEASSQDSDTGRSLNGTSSSVMSAFSVHSEFLSSQHEANMKEDIARIQEEIKRLEEHLAKTKQAAKGKVQSTSNNLTNIDVEEDNNRTVSDSEEEAEIDDEFPHMYHNDTDAVPDSRGMDDNLGNVPHPDSVEAQDRMQTNANDHSNNILENDLPSTTSHEVQDERPLSPTPPPQMSNLATVPAISLTPQNVHNEDSAEDKQPSNERQETEALFSPSQRIKTELDIQGGQYKKKNLSNLRSPLVPIAPSVRNLSAKKSVTSLVSPKPTNAVKPSPGTPGTPVTPISRIKTEQAPSPAVSDYLELPQRPSWVITTSGITKMKIKTRIEKFVKLIGCKLAGKFSSSTTHVIIAQDEGSDDPLMCQRTLKYFQGVAGGRWMLSHLWIVESLSKGQILPPEDYEIHGDVVHGMHRAPRRARLSTSPLLEDFEVCCYAEFRDLKKDDVHDIIEMVGGCIVQHPSMFSFDPAKRPVILVEDDNKKDCTALRKFHKMYEVPVVAKDWLLDSVGCYKLQKISEWAVDLNPSGRS